MTVIFGASGHAKEIEFFVRVHQENRIDYFISIHADNHIKSVPVISEEHFLGNILPKILPKKCMVYIAIGASGVRKKIVSVLSKYSKIEYPNLILRSIRYDFNSVLMGVGNILFPSVQFTVDAKIGNHNHFNLNVSVSHDCIIGDYNTFSPGVKVAGNVSIGNNNFFGIGCVIIDNISIGNDIIIGAGAVVVENILIPGTYVGVPAKKIK